MSRLIIVDQSLKGLGGHHFDYTLQVAKAAASRQCEVIVATNRKFRGCSRLDHFARIHPVFRNTSYSRFSLLAGLRAMFGQPPLELAEGQKATPLKFVEEVPSTRVERAKQVFSQQFGRFRSARSRVNSRLKYIRESTGRNRVVKSFARDCQTLFRSIGLHPSDHVFFPTISDLDLAGLLTYWMSNPESHLPAWHMQFHFDVFVGRSPDYRRQLTNLNPLRDLFDDVERAVPSYHLNYYATTASIADQYQRLSSRQVSELAYPISDGFLNPATEPKSDLGLFVAPKFDSAEHCLGHSDLGHSGLEHSGLKHSGLKHSAEADVDPFERQTDCESNPEDWGRASELNSSEDQLSIAGMREDPLSSITSRNFADTQNDTKNGTHDIDSHQTDLFGFPAEYHGVPVVVAGGVRGEKGQACLTNLLPELDEKIFSSDLGFLVCQRKVQQKWWKKPTFSLSQQGNRETKDGQMDAYSKSICYLPHPLEPKHYQQLIRQAGIGLLAYDRESYANRRAGIFGEYLAAGVPVLVPAGTWMADQLESAQRKYLQQLRGDLELSQRIGFHQLDWADWNVPAANGAVSFDGLEVPAYAWSPELKDYNGDGHRLVRVAFQWLWPKESGTYCKVQVLFHSADNEVLGSTSCVVGDSGAGEDCETIFAVPPATSTIRFGFSNAYHERNASIQHLRIEVLECEESVPLGAIGLTYDSIEQIPELLAEMCHHHTHYQNQARSFASQWYDGHDPLQTVTQLISTSQSAQSWAA